MELWIILVVVLGVPSISFFVLVYLGYRTNNSMDQGEMRRAITVFFIVLFGLVVTSSFFPAGPNLPEEIKGLFAGTVATVIGYYFGARTAAPSPGKTDNTQENQENQTNPDD